MNRQLLVLIVTSILQISIVIGLLLFTTPAYANAAMAICDPPSCGGCAIYADLGAGCRATHCIECTCWGIYYGQVVVEFTELCPGGGGGGGDDGGGPGDPNPE